MSEIELHFGKLRKVVFQTGQTKEEWCKEKCKELGVIEISSYNDTWEEELRSETRHKYFFFRDEVWEVFEYIEGDEDVDIMIPNEDGSITFCMQFYNGGTCLSEMIEDGLERLTRTR